MADKEKTELKPAPCPLCNGKASCGIPIPEYDNCDDKQLGWTLGVLCGVCGLTLESGFENLVELGRIKAKLITAWNNRKDSTAHEQSLLLKLEGMYQTVRGLKEKNKLLHDALYMLTATHCICCDEVEECEDDTECAVIVAARKALKGGG